MGVVWLRVCFGRGSECMVCRGGWIHSYGVETLEVTHLVSSSI